MRPCKHGKVLYCLNNIFGNPTNSAKNRLVISRKIEPNFSNIFGNLTISASRAPSVAFEWYTMKYPTRHLYFVSIHTSLWRLCSYRKKFKCLVGYNYSIRSHCSAILLLISSKIRILSTSSGASRLVYTKTVDSVEGARWLARQTPNILCYLPPSNSRENGVPFCIRDKWRNHSKFKIFLV